MRAYVLTRTQGVDGGEEGGGGGGVPGDHHLQGGLRADPQRREHLRKDGGKARPRGGWSYKVSGKIFDILILSLLDIWNVQN